MTDADLLPTGPDECAAFWRDQLQQSTHTRSRIGRSALGASPRVVAACSSRSPIVTADGWVAVGDAAAAFDPLSSLGVAWALESGLMAAAAIDGRLRGRPDGIRSGVMCATSSRGFIRYLEMRADYYGRERRWPDSPFWRRRHAPCSQAVYPGKNSGEKPGNSRKGIRSQSYLMK